MLPAVIDAHAHWRDPVHNPYESLSDAVNEDGQRTGRQAEVYLPTNYQDDSAGLTVKGIVHIEAEWDKSDPIGETRWLHSLVDKRETAGLPLVVVGYADLSQPGVEALFEAHASFPRTRGIRHMLNRVEGRPELCWADRDYLADPRWHEGYAQLARYNLHFDLMCFGEQMEPFAKLAEKHPDIPVHLEHAGLPWDHSDEGRKRWREGMRALAALDHADVKISGLGNTIANWTQAKIRTYVLETIDIFGVERVSFASNTPTDKRFGPIADIWRAFDSITSDFSDDDRTKLFHTNALHSYQFDR